MHASAALPDRTPTLGEEIAHALSHGLGALLAVGAVVLLVVQAVVHRDATTVSAVSTFGATLVGLYLSSTVYHAVPARLRRLKQVLQIVDHAAIHLLIAGTVTPFALCAIGGARGWAVFGLTWTLAAIGVVVETTPLRRFTRLSMALYVGSGWAGAGTLPLLWDSLKTGSLTLLGLGGVAYTAGVPFYLASRRWSHSIWHLFVLIGSALHVAAIALVVSG